MENNSEAQLGLLKPIRFTTFSDIMQNNFNDRQFGKNLGDSLERLYGRVQSINTKDVYTEPQTTHTLDNPVGLELSISRFHNNYLGNQIYLRISQLESVEPICKKNLHLSIIFGFKNQSTFLGLKLNKPKLNYAASIINPNIKDNKKNRAVSTNPTQTSGQLKCNYELNPKFGTCLEILANLDNYFLNKNLKPNPLKSWFI
jgi:hypothetical protein